MKKLRLLSITTALILSFTITRSQTTINISDLQSSFSSNAPATWYSKDTIKPSSNIELDTFTCIPNSELRKGAELIEKGKMYAQQLQLTNEKVDILNQRIELGKTIIAELSKDTALYGAVIVTYQKQVGKLEEEKVILLNESHHLDKLLRRQKRLTVIGIAGTAAVAVGLYILLK